MHSGRMRTARLLTYPRGGGVCLGGGLHPGGGGLHRGGGALLKRVCIGGGGLPNSPRSAYKGGLHPGESAQPPQVCLWGGLHLGGGSANPCRSAYGGGDGQTPLPPVNRMTHRYKNITLLQINIQRLANVTSKHASKSKGLLTLCWSL